MMSPRVLYFVLVLSCYVSSWADALSINNITCSGTTLHEIRVEGCTEQPCKIKKGQPLPFEIDMSFETPGESADDVYFNVFLPKFAKPPAHGSSLITATCDQGGLGFQCPVEPNTKYTLKSELLIDPASVCTAKCQNMSDNGTGVRVSKWRWTISSHRVKRRKSGSVRQKGYSVCSFKLALDITE